MRRMEMLQLAQARGMWMGRSLRVTGLIQTEMGRILGALLLRGVTQVAQGR